MLQLSKFRRNFGNSDRIKTVKFTYPKLVFLNLVSRCAVVKVRFQRTLKTIQSDPRLRIFAKFLFERSLTFRFRFFEALINTNLFCPVCDRCYQILVRFRSEHLTAVAWDLLPKS